MTYKYIVRVDHRFYIYPLNGDIHLTDNIDEAGEFDSEIEAKGTHEFSYPNDYCEVIKVKPKPQQ